VVVDCDYNCDYTVTDTIAWDGGECSEGVLTRIFTVTAPNGMTSICEQEITVENENDYLIVFPADDSDFCNGDGGDDIQTMTNTCDIFAITKDTVRYEVDGTDACFKRYVRYTVINWCEYDGISLQPTVIPRDMDCDGDVTEETYVRVVDGKVYIDDDNEPTVDPEYEFETTANEYLACNNLFYQVTPGFYEYTQVVKVYDEEAPIINIDTLEFCAYGTTGALPCNGEVMIPFTAVDSCTDSVEVRLVMLDVDNQGNPVNAIGELYELTEVTNGEYTISSIAGQGLPVGEHTFMVTVADFCGNVQVRNIPFSVKDCKTPAPICKSILSVDLMPIVENKTIVGGMNVVWATDFIASSIEDCTPHPQADPLADGKNEVRYYAVRQDSLTAAGLTTPTEDYIIEENREVTFTCADEGTAVTVFVIGVDGAGNFDYCTVMVSVESGADPCGEPTVVEDAAIAGLIMTEEDETVEGVQVDLNGGSIEVMNTDFDGAYEFNPLVAGNDYTVAPQLDVDPLNGVSTFDLVLITKHILGVESLESPYRQIAADVNRSGSITTVDLIQLRKLILSIDANFKNNTSWRFVDSKYEFADPSRPFDEEFPEIVNVNNLAEMMMDVDFVAIKIGDVNSSAIPNSLIDEPRNLNGLFEIDVEDRSLKAGETYEVVLTTEEMPTTQGFQFTLTFDPALVSLADVKFGLLQRENIGLTHTDDGAITVSWNDPSGRVMNAANTELITLQLQAVADVELNEVLGISSRYTMTEAYAVTGNTEDIALTFSSGVITGLSYELYQNVPNPFVQSTMIGFNLPEAANATLTVRDAKGKLIKVIEGDFGRGYNQVQIDRDDLPTGVLYYTLESGDYIYTRRMIVIE
ncbi:MAG: T9SS type A sorting domain-containing protein, partial [Bacteroidota bacterium]